MRYGETMLMSLLAPAMAARRSRFSVAVSFETSVDGSWDWKL
jgi:hypothetical protein